VKCAAWLTTLDKRFEVLHALRYYWGQRCRWRESSQLNDELLMLGYRTEDPVHLQAALRLTGANAFHQGRLQEALHYFEQAVSLFEVGQQRSHNQDHEQDQGIANLRRIVPALWLRGYPDQAQARLKELLARTREIARPFDLLMSLDFAFDLAHYLRHSQAGQEYAAEYSALTAKHRYPHCVAVEKTFRGWVLAGQGNADEGIALIKQGIDQLREMGTLLFSSQGLALLIEALVQAGRFAQGVALVDEVLSFLAGLGESYWNAEFQRLKGDMLLALGSNTAEVEHCYQQAFTTAREQGARSLELRAAVSLARLWQLQGNHADAYLLLADIYTWFTEGFDTPDLQEASALLAELKRSV
jgi:predicted ATPase